MKTRNNQLVTLAIFAFLLLVGNVNAKGNELTALSHESIKEQALEIENWMVNENNWNTNNFASEFVIEVDSQLELESWMTEEANWNAFDNSFFVNDVEAKIELEAWMTDNLVWMVPEAQEKEEKLALENWMENDNVWFR